MCDGQRKRSLLSGLCWLAALLFLIIMGMVATLELIETAKRILAELIYWACRPLAW